MSKSASCLLWLFALLLLSIGTAQARELRVTLLAATGMDQTTYTIPEDQVREFWIRWDYLEKSDQMIPLGQPNSYRGLTVRDVAESGEDRVVRIFSGIAYSEASNRETRRDAGRLLERWVLSKAPPPFGPSLLRALDEEISNTPGVPLAPAATKTPGAVLIRSCQSRAHGNISLRITCLEDSLEKQLGTEAYLSELEKSVGALTIEPRYATEHDIPAARRPPHGDGR